MGGKVKSSSSLKIACWGGFEYSFPRKIPGTILIAALTSPIGVPFEIARMAYYGDKTFPKELQRGYTSYFNALRRIPFEEGIYMVVHLRSLLFVQEFVPVVWTKLLPNLDVVLHVRLLEG